MFYEELLKTLEFLTWLKPNGFAGRNRHFGASSRIAAYACLPGAHVENAEPAELNALALRQRSLHALKDSFHRHFSFCLGNSGAVDYFVDDVEFNQSKPLSAADDPARQI